MGNGISGVVLVAGVRIWDSVPEARVVGVAVPLVVVEPGPCFAAFLARNFARRAAGSLSMLNNAQWTTMASVWGRGVSVVVALAGCVVGIVRFLCAKGWFRYATRDSWDLFGGIQPMMQKLRLLMRSEGIRTPRGIGIKGLNAHGNKDVSYTAMLLLNRRTRNILCPNFCDPN